MGDRGAPWPWLAPEDRPGRYSADGGTRYDRDMIAVIGSPRLARDVAPSPWSDGVGSTGAVGSAATRGSVASDEGTRGRAAGLAARIALAAAAAGADVQLIGKVGDDAAGDAVVLALARGGVGHLALLRAPGETPVAAVMARRTGDDGDAEGLVATLLGDVLDAETPGEPGDAPHPATEPDVAAGPGLPLEPADVSLGLNYLSDFRVVVAADPLEDAAARVVADATAFVEGTLVAVTVPGRRVPAAFETATVFEAPTDDPDGAFATLVGRFAAALDRGQPASAAFRDATTAGGWSPTER